MDMTKTYIEFCDAGYDSWKLFVTPMLLQTQTFWEKTLHK